MAYYTHIGKRTKGEAMSEFVRAGDRLINLSNVVEVKVTEAREEIRITSQEMAAEYDYPRNDYLPARPLTVEIVTTTVTSQWDDGGDFPEFKHTEYHPYGITLRGAEAEEFLGRIYIPAPNGSQPATVMAG
jgi:hypothetical protein